MKITPIFYINRDWIELQKKHQNKHENLLRVDCCLYLWLHKFGYCVLYI